VLLDTRKESKTFGQYACLRLGGVCSYPAPGENSINPPPSNLSVFVPAGVAHGFLSVVDDMVLMYAKMQAKESEILNNL
jgi:hypothetical protein